MTFFFREDNKDKKYIYKNNFIIYIFTGCISENDNRLKYH